MAFVSVCLGFGSLRLTLLDVRCLSVSLSVSGLTERRGHSLVYIATTLAGLALDPCFPLTPGLFFITSHPFDLTSLFPLAFEVKELKESRIAKVRVKNQGKECV